MANEKGNPNIVKDGEKTRFSSTNQPKNKSAGPRKFNGMIKNELLNYLESKNAKVSFRFSSTKVVNGKEVTEYEEKELDISSDETLAKLIAFTAIQRCIDYNAKDNLAAIIYVDNRTGGKMPLQIETTTQHTIDLSQFNEDELNAIQAAKNVLLLKDNTEDVNGEIVE